MSGFKVRVVNMGLIWFPYHYCLQILKIIKSVFKKIEFFVDYYIGFLFFSEKKYYRYKRYMKKKWGIWK
jgi:hypothetical protein